MKRFRLGIIAATTLLAGGAASAADLPVTTPQAMPVIAAVVNWSGFYVGGNAGFAGSRDLYSFDVHDVTCDFACEDFRFSPSSFIGGGQIGYQSQVDKWVFGIEATWSVLDLHQTKPSALDPASLRSIKIDDIATVGARFGYAGWERVLVYARAAYATARIGVHGIESGGGITSDAAAGATGDWNGWRSGWNLGAGVEYMAWQNLILGVEFNFYSFDFDTKQPITFSDGTLFEIAGSKADVYAVTARLSYLFNWGKTPTAIVAKY